MSNSQADVVRQFEAQIDIMDCNVAVVLEYFVASPLIVHMTILIPGDDLHLIKWEFARDLLWVGAVKPVGNTESDIRITPRPPLLIIRLQSAGTACELSFSITEIRAFLAATEKLVPPGQEDTSAATEAFLANLFNPPR